MRPLPWKRSSSPARWWGWRDAADRWQWRSAPHCPERPRSPHTESSVARLEWSCTPEQRHRKRLPIIKTIEHCYEIWKHGIGLNELLGEGIVQILQQERSHARARSSGNAVHQHESLFVISKQNTHFQTVAILRLARQNIHRFLAEGAALFVSRTPVVSCANSIGPDEARRN